MKLTNVPLCNCLSENTISDNLILTCVSYYELDIINLQTLTYLIVTMAATFKKF